MTLQPTPYDLRWRMFGIPARVHPSFWLIAALFTWPLTQLEFTFLFVGIGSIFLSVLVHELAHAIAFAAFGARSAIILYSFGGLTIPEAGLRQRSARIVVSLAGPFSNFLLIGLLWASDRLVPWALSSLYAFVAFQLLIAINLFLGILNLLPVWPLDGGQVSRELWMASDPRGGRVRSLRMSMIVAIAFAVFAIACEFRLVPTSIVPGELQPGMFAGIMFGLMGAQNYFELRNTSRPSWE
jgi:Zn-dependent protease